ncbi:MAG TPA: SRPBCC family protein [Rhizomicrobium sp.]|nr:SRPBCC family protein [Rhizomicrobium sp.]
MEDFAEKLDAHTIRFVRILPGPIERVWEYLWDSEKRGLWFASGAMPSTVGESFSMRFKHSELSPHSATPPEKMAEMDRTGHTSSNTLLVYEPPHRLVFTFGGEKNFYSEVEFRLDPEDSGKVRFTLIHSKIPDRQYMMNVSGGWHTHLAVLEERAHGRTPPAFWDVWRRYDGVYDKRYA